MEIQWKNYCCNFDADVMAPMFWHRCLGGDVCGMLKASGAEIFRHTRFRVETFLTTIRLGTDSLFSLPKNL